jgi:hypothetical protein
MPALTRMTIARSTDARLAHLLATDDLSEDDREAIEDEIEARDEYRANHDDTPSLQDGGNELGSYTA